MIEGLLGKKIGTTRIFAEDGTVQPVTVIEAGPCVITQVKTAAKEGYNAVQLGYGAAKKLSGAEKGHLGELGLLRHLREFRMKDVAGMEVGTKADVGLFTAGDRVDLIATSKGRGFAGVVKRHHFKGGPKTHGQSDRHRAPGSVGSTTSPGHVLRGLRMAGHMGNERVTVQNVKVLKVELDRNLIMVKGSVPGPNGGLVQIKKAAA